MGIAERISIVTWGLPGITNRGVGEWKIQSNKKNAKFSILIIHYSRCCTISRFLFQFKQMVPHTNLEDKGQHAPSPNTRQAVTSLKVVLRQPGPCLVKMLPVLINTHELPDTYDGFFLPWLNRWCICSPALFCPTQCATFVLRSRSFYPFTPTIFQESLLNETQWHFRLITSKSFKEVKHGLKWVSVLYFLNYLKTILYKC